MESMFSDYQKIDGEIIDYGIFEDEFDQIQMASRISPKLPSNVLNEDETRQLSNTSTSEGSDYIFDTIDKTKCLCVKVVDCKKYPRYYRKYKKQLLKFQHSTQQNCVASNRDIDTRNSVNLYTSNTCETSAVIYKVSGDDSVVKEQSNKNTSTIHELSNSEKIIIRSDNRTDAKKGKYKGKRKIQKRTDVTKSMDIYFKNGKKPACVARFIRHKLLITKKVQTMKYNNKIQEKPKIKRTKMQENSTIESERHHKKTYLEFVRKADPTKTMKLYFDLTKKNVIKVINVDKNKQHTGVMLPQPASAQKHSLKIPSSKAIKLIKEGEKSSHRNENTDFQIVGHKNIITHIGNKQKYENIVVDTEKNKPTHLQAAVTSHSPDRILSERINETIKYATKKSHKQYSPPILPIPTYQKILSEVRTLVLPNSDFQIIIPERQAPNIEDQRKPASLNTKIRCDKNTNQKESSKKSISAVSPREDSRKKISLEEYKKRNRNIGNKQVK